MHEYKVISPNLDRRPDRWKLFYDILKSQGVPADQIERFPAHDGRQYQSTREAMAHAAEIHQGNPPHYLATGEKLDKFNWCWNWSWYDCLERIAERTDETPVMFLIDDFKVNFDYHEICIHIEGLVQLGMPFRVAQYGGPGRDSPSRVIREALRELPIFQRGFAGAWDICTLYSPIGARWFLDFINSIERHGRPCNYSGSAAQNAGEMNCGIYGASIHTNSWSDWITRLPTGEDDYVQDRQEVEAPK